MSASLVTCIMPTRNRRPFVEQAIWYFLRQDYPRKELLILDDGEDAVGDVVPPDDRIRYVRLDRAMSVGAKRNLGCELSHGDLIAHWDDDDWMAPQRLSAQVAQLENTGSELCGAREVLYFKPSAGETWLYRWPPGERPWLAGGTLVYRRASWAERRFPDADVGEDTAFVWRFPSERMCVTSDRSLYVALIHSGNTGMKSLVGPRWERRAPEEAASLLAPDRDFYSAVRNGFVAVTADGNATRPESLCLAANFDVFSGYGSIAEHLAVGLARAGATVNLVPFGLDLRGMSEEFAALVHRSQPHPGEPVLYFSWPRADLDRFRGTKDLFINTMWESNRLPAAWPAVLDRACAVIVPTRFVARACRESGVRAPIEVVPEGIDPSIYHYVERPARPGLTTLTIGPIDDRKHVLTGIAAWKEAFRDDPHARLIIKTQYNYQNFTPDDPRIRYIDVAERTRGILHWYREADVLLALGNEGFGLPLIEGMATGLPVIALSSEGQGDVCDEASDLLLPVAPGEWRPYDNSLFGRCGVRGVPSVSDVAAKLRWVSEHREEAQEMGRAASRWAVRHRDIAAKAPVVLDIVERYLRPPRSLRRAITVWVPSWGTACGLAEYTAQLAGASPALRISAAPPEPRTARVIHVQHHTGIFDEMAVTRLLRDARARRVPTVVTEHSVFASIVQPWEREATVLVSLTAGGAEILRRRHRSARVEHIPPGCPTWFPPRKRQRGRVIGAFGFAASYKGFAHLAAIVRRLPGAELLLFSHARPGETSVPWGGSADDERIRWVREFLPAEEIARRLAAEADVLVFWYDEVAHLSASAAVRVGLATGVPVITSRTSWFTELRDVTHQPDDPLEGVRTMLEDTPQRERLSTAAREYCEANSWPRTAERHLALWRSLERS